MPSGRAYLLHWLRLVALEKSKLSAVTAMTSVDVEWDHGDAAKSKAGVKEMGDGFGLAVRTKSNVAPALHSNHIAGKAIDMDIAWTGNLKVKKKDGTIASLLFMINPNLNTKLHAVGVSYGVKKHEPDAPHWSIDGF